MKGELLNVGLAFFEGFALILSPCILPILPIILAGSLTGGRKRPLGIILGFILAFSLFTFFSRELVSYSGINLNLVRQLSYGLLLVLGLVMLSTRLSEKFSRLTRNLSRVGSNWSSINGEDWLSGLIFGGLIALIWTPCAGPILAAVIVQTVIQTTTFLSFLTILAFAAGAAGPMLIIAFCGRGILAKLSFFKKQTYLLRKLLGLIIIGTVGYLIYFESGLSIEKSVTSKPSQALVLEQGLSQPYPAPELAGISAWINSPPIKLSDLRGKVVLLDFWTYSCINCIRTFPYLKSWYEKYQKEGLVIIGIHSPEFDFEKDLANVKAAVKQAGLLYPVALDNDFVTWRHFENKYWPAHYLIDQNGRVVYVHFGEGDYEITENNIRFLLGLHNPAPTSSGNNSALTPLTPETYFGYAREERFASAESLQPDQIAQYHFPAALPLNHWALQGKWLVHANQIVAADSQAALELHFSAKNIFIVMGSGKNKTISVKLSLNGKALKRMITVTQPRLYEALTLDQPGEGILQVQASTPGLEIYTFTFGN